MRPLVLLALLVHALRASDSLRRRRRRDKQHLRVHADQMQIGGEQRVRARVLAQHGASERRRRRRAQRTRRSLQAPARHRSHQRERRHPHVSRRDPSRRGGQREHALTALQSDRVGEERAVAAARTVRRVWHTVLLLVPHALPCAQLVSDHTQVEHQVPGRLGDAQLPARPHPGLSQVQGVHREERRLLAHDLQPMQTRVLLGYVYV